MITKQEMIGKRFNNVVVLSYDKNNYYTCKCDCGKIFKRRKDSILNKNNKTCGSCQRECHGDTHTRLYNIYKNMISRCIKSYANHYEDYGGRGISICDDWKKSYLSFKNWSMKNGYRNNLTLDRINNNGNYEPSNCRWVTRKVQSNNTRRNKMITYKGKTQSFGSWCDELNIKRTTLRKKLEHTNYDLEKALKLPYKFNTRHRKIDMLDISTGEHICTFEYLQKAYEYIAKERNCKSNKPSYTHIKEVCDGKRHYAYGYKWRYNEGGDIGGKTIIN